MSRYQSLAVQAQRTYDAALTDPYPDWRAIAELFRAALRPAPKRALKSPDVKGNSSVIADHNVDRCEAQMRSPRIAVRFMDGEAVFTQRAFGTGQAAQPAVPCASQS